MNRIDRLLGILVLLQTKKYTSAEKIAEHYQISIRTVYRDIKALIEQGIPISFEQPKGYFIVQGYFLPPVSFNSEEANALLIMERLVAGFADQSIHMHYTNALNKVKAVLRHSQKERLEFLNDNIKLQLPDFIKNEYQHLSVLQQVISTKSIIEIDYTNNEKESSTRRLESIGLIFYAFNWHLIAWCHNRKDYRDFRVSRIVKIKCLDLPFEKTQHRSVSDYMKELPVNY
eukprot:gene4788-5575_t